VNDWRQRHGQTEVDTWDITEGMGTITLGMAAAWAAETAGARPLVEGPYAIMFLDAADDGFWNALLAAPSTGKPGDIDPELPRSVRAMFDYVAVRTVFFDDFFTAAANSGIRQVVILGSGLDARAWRPRWPEGTTVYEIDQVKVLKFKSATLAAQAARPAARLVNVAADLRHHWPQALRWAGHEPASPTAWSAERLLAFLPPDAQDQLFHHMQDLSAPGSRIAAVAVNTNFDTCSTRCSGQAVPAADTRHRRPVVPRGPHRCRRLAAPPPLGHVHNDPAAIAGPREPHARSCRGHDATQPIHRGPTARAGGRISNNHAMNAPMMPRRSSDGVCLGSLLGWHAARADTEVNAAVGGCLSTAQRMVSGRRGRRYRSSMA
jgi:methyltransferase (TIGR00027 family)